MDELSQKMKLSAATGMKRRWPFWCASGLDVSITFMSDVCLLVKENADGVESSIRRAEPCGSLCLKTTDWGWGWGHVSSRSSPLCCTPFAYACASTCVFGDYDCWFTADSTELVMDSCGFSFLNCEGLSFFSTTTRILDFFKALFGLN